MIICPSYITLFLALLLGFSTQGTDIQQEQNIWRTLALMKFERQDDNGGFASSGKIIPMIEALDGKEVTVKGYVIPLNGRKAQSHFMFSAYPYANCFFCGNAGPESVMEVFAKGDEKIEYSDDTILIKGIFRFTSRNPEDIMFTLEDAVLVEG